MTIYDLMFLVLFFGVILMLAIAGMAALLRFTRLRNVTLRVLAVLAIAYMGTWAALTATSKQTPLRVGDPQYVDIWCLAVEDVKWTPRDHTNVYDVTLCIFSRANRSPTSFGAHAAANETSDVYLVDSRGKRYDPLPHGSELPLNVAIGPGEAVRTHRVFEIPSDARELGLLAGRGSLGVCPMVGECSTSHAATRLCDCFGRVPAGVQLSRVGE